MRIIRWLTVCALALLAAAASGGTLYGYPTLPSNTYDFNYQTAKSQPYSALSGPISLSVQYTWNSGSTGAQIVEPQHALLAFTQMSTPTGYFNTTGDQIWTHGVGAFVGEHGLEMELWFRNGSTNNSIVWGQHEGRCARDVLGTLPPGTMCLSATPSAAGYITPYPGFVLRKWATYVVKIRVSPTSPGWSKLEAELWQPGTFGMTMTQSGMVGFENAAFFPLTGQTLNAAVARTPGEPSILYTVLP